jgi:hypothetical protein
MIIPKNIGNHIFFLFFISILNGSQKFYNDKIIIYIDNGVDDFQVYKDRLTTSNKVLNNKLRLEKAKFIRKWLPKARTTDRDGDVYLNRYYVVEFHSAKESIEKTIEEFLLLVPIRFAEIIPIIELSFQPNDEFWQALYGLRQVKADSAYGLYDIDNGEIPGQMPSSEIVVAIPDASLMWDHPDLFENIWRNLGEDVDGDGTVLEYINDEWVFDPDDINNIDDDGDGYIDNFVGYDINYDTNDPYPISPTNQYHGTMVAGCVSAVTNNQIGISSVGFSVKLMGLNCGDNQGYIPTGFEGILAAAHMGADIINCSWGMTSYIESNQAVINTVYNEYGCVIVGSAGNYGSNQAYYPASYDNVVSVTSTSQGSTFSCWANRHETVDIAAPGDDILCTTTIVNDDGELYEIVDGTSFSAPIVSGALALIKSIFPDADNDMLITKIIGGTSYFPDMDGDCDGEELNGFLGSGQLNIYQAILLNIAPELYASNVTISTEGGLFYPGDTTDVIITLSNAPGHASVENVIVSLSIDDPMITIISSEYVFADILASGTEFDAQFLITSSESMSFGDIPFNLNISAELSGNFPSSLSYETYELETEVLIPFGFNQDGYPVENLNIQGSPLCVDLYGNSFPQIYFGSDSMMYGTWMSGFDAIGFPFDVENEISSSAAAGDLDGDGDKELVFGTMDGTLYALNKNGTEYLNYVQPDPIIDFPALNDLDNSGSLEIIFIAGNDTSATLYAINNAGDDVTGFPFTIPERIVAGPAVADIDDSGTSDIVIVTLDSNIYAIDVYGSLKSGFPFLSSDGIQTPATLADLDGDQDLEIITGNEGGNVYVLHHDGSIMVSFVMEHPIRGGISIADLDRNGQMELLFSGLDQYVHAWNPIVDGEIAGWPVNIGSVSISEPIVVDLDNDLNLEVITATSEGTIYISHHDGSSYQNFPYISQDSIHSTPTIGDLDNDGDYELIVGTEMNLKVLDILDDKGDQYSWKAYRNNSHRDGYYDVSLSYLAMDKNITPKEFSLGKNYPNPFNPITNIPYGLPEDMRVIIKVYDIKGSVVKTLVDRRQSAGHNSIFWNGTNNLGAPVSTGLYFYRIESSKFIQTKKMIFLK